MSRRGSGIEAELISLGLLVSYVRIYGKEKFSSRKHGHYIELRMLKNEDYYNANNN